MAAFSRSGVRACEFQHLLELGLGLGRTLGGRQADDLGDVELGAVEPEQIRPLLGARVRGQGKAEEEAATGQGVAKMIGAHHVMKSIKESGSGGGAAKRRRRLISASLC